MTDTVPASVAVIDEAHLARLVDQLLADRLAGTEDRLIAALEAVTETRIEPTLTVPDMAGIFQCCEKTIRRWRVDGFLPPAIEIGGYLRWHRDVVRAFLALYREAAAEWLKEHGDGVGRMVCKHLTHLKEQL